MATEVEERIVQMKFDNAQFEKGAKQSLITLEKLDGVLDRLGQGGLDHLANTLDVVERRFSSFGIAGMAAIQKITNSAIDLGVRLMTAIPRQIISGGTTRAMNLEQAQFQLKGLGIAWEQAYDAMDYAVSGTAYGLDEAAKAAAQFAASNKAMLTTVNADGITDMAKALRAISGVAGMTNSSYDEIAHIFTGIAGTGHVMTQDLRMLEGRGMNVAAKLAEVLSDGPQNIKYTEEQIREMVSKGEIDFLTFAKAMDYAFGDHAKKANETYTGSLANMKAALSRIGADFVLPWHNGMIKIQNALRNTFNLARKVTQPFAEGRFTQWTERLSDIISRLAGNIKFGWLDSLLNLAGAAGDKILNVLEAITDAFPRGLFGDDKILAFTNQDAMNRYSKLQHILAGIRVIFDSLKKIGKGVFENLFGGKDFDAVQMVDRLLDKGKQFGDWLVNLNLKNQGFMSQIQNAIEKITNVLSSAGKVVRSVGNVIGAVLERIFGYLGKNGGKILGRLGTILNGLADGITGANNKLSEFLDKIAEFIREHGVLGGVLEAVSDGFWNLGSGIFSAIRKVTEFVKGLLGLKDGVNAWERVSSGFKKAGEVVRNAIDLIRNGLQNLFGPGGIGEGAIVAASLLYSALFGFRKYQTTKWSFQRLGRGIELIRHSSQTLWKWMKAINPLEYIDKVETVLGRTSGALRAFADNLNAKSLLTIGGAVLVLAAGLGILFALAGDAQRMTVAITGLAAVMGILVAAASAMWKIFGSDKLIMGTVDKNLKGFKKLKAVFGNFGSFLTGFADRFARGYNFQQIAKGLLYFAGAVLVLAVAVGVFGYTYEKFGWQGMAAGVIGMAAAIGVLVAAVALLDKYVKSTMPFKMAGIAVALVGLGVALLLVVGAMWALSRLSWTELAKGMLGVAVGIGVLVAAIAFLGSSIEGKGARIKLRAVVLALSLVAVASAVLILAIAIRVIATLPMQQLGLALGALAIGLFAMVGALALLGQIEPGKLLSAGVAMMAAGVAMILLAAAMTIMTVALMALSVIPYDALMNSLKALGLTLLGIVAALVILGAMGPIVLAAGGAILMVGIAFLALGAGLSLAGTGLIKLAVAANMLDGVNLLKLSGGLLALSAALAALGVGGLLTSFASGGFDGLVVLATAMKMMQGLDFKTLNDKENGLRGLAKSLRAFGGLKGIWLSLGAGGLVTVGPALVSLAAGVKAMVPAMKELTTIENPEKALGIYEGIANSARKLMSIGAFSKRADTEGFADAIVAIVPAIKQLDDIQDPHQAITVLGAIAEAGQIMGSAGFFQHNTDMSGVADALVKIVPVMHELNGVEDPAKVRQVLDAIAYAGSIFGTTEFWNKSVDVTSVGTAMSTILPSIRELNGVTIDPENVAAILKAIGEAGRILGGMSVFERQSDVIAIGDALKAVIPVIQDMNGITTDPASIDSILTSVANAGKKLGTMSFASKGTDVEAIASALRTVIPVIQELNAVTIDADSVDLIMSAIGSTADHMSEMPVFKKQADVAAIADALNIIIPVIADLGTITDPTGVALTLDTLGPSLQTFGTRSFWTKESNMDGIADAIVKIVPAIVQLGTITDPTGVALTLDTLGPSLQTFGTRSFWSKESNINGIADAITKIVPAVLQLEQISDTEGLSTKMSILGSAIEAFGTRGIFSKEQSLVPVADGLVGIASALSSLTDDQVSRLGQLAAILMTDFGAGISGAALEIEGAFSTMLGDMTMAVTAYDPTWVTLGGNITAGIANGIVSRTSEAVSAMSNMASSLATSFTVTLGIKSPSRVFAGLAGYIPAGVAKGVTDNSGQITDAMITAMSPAMMVLMSLMSTDFDFSPTITPVVDLTNVTNAANAMGSMFGSTQVSAEYDSRISGLVDNVGNLATQMGDVTNVTNNSGDTFNFSIYANEGMDEEALADLVARRVGEKIARRRVATG